MSDFDQSHYLPQSPGHEPVVVPGVSASNEAKEEGPNGEVFESVAGGFENAESAMDFVANHDHMSSGVKTFAGLNSGLLSMVAAGADGYEAASDLHKGKKAKGAGELVKSGASVVAGGAGAYHAAAEGFAKYGASEEGKELFEHNVSVADHVGNVAGGMAGGVGGIMDIAAGNEKYHHGKNIDEKTAGLDQKVGGYAETGGGLAKVMTGLSGTNSLGLTADVVKAVMPEGAVSLGGVASVAGPALGAFATGMQIGHYGDEEAKKLGVFHDAKGNAESASDWASEKGTAADEWVTEHLHSKGLGTVAGLATTGGASIAGGLAAGESAVAGAEKAVGHAAHKLWDWL